MDTTSDSADTSPAGLVCDAVIDRLPAVSSVEGVHVHDVAALNGTSQAGAPSTNTSTELRDRFVPLMDGRVCWVREPVAGSVIVGAGGGRTVTPYVPVSDAIVVDPDENPAAASRSISRTTATRVNSAQPSADGGEHDVLSPVPEQSKGEDPSAAVPLAETIDVPEGAVSTHGAPDGSG